ncbi:MAG: type I methionyl aminopeptidase [Planctomycetes bacterium]|nr:type I methionyl aminopeptidase [Planctomycetota bacterium]MBI3846650.1 type I methionyl aminopeptidase [Planctomycetota bacterium]
MITVKSPRELEIMRAAGRMVANALHEAEVTIKPGLTTAALDRRIDEVIRAQGGRPAFKGYRGFPASICVSVNEEVVHGIPGGRRLREGDIVSVDVGVEYRGYFGDAASTFSVGPASAETLRLLDVCRQSLERGIQTVAAGVRLLAVSAAIEAAVREAGLGVVEKFVGHGIGRKLHEEPQVPNFVGDASIERSVLLKAGMTLAIEPMVNAGTGDVEVLDNGWTVVTRDRKWSAHFEHTVAVTEGGAQILTLP